jgi:hypothetical protein
MLSGSYDGPLRVGTRLEIVGRLLGPPKHWDYAAEDFFYCQMSYCDFELAFVIRNGVVVLDQFWIELWEPRDGKPAPKSHSIGINTKGRHIKTELGPFGAGVGLGAVRRELSSRGLVSQDIERNDAFETSRILKLSTGAELHFFQGSLEEILMEIVFTGNS